MILAIWVCFSIDWSRLLRVTEQLLSSEDASHDLKLPHLPWQQVSVVKLNQELTRLLDDGRAVLRSIIHAEPRPSRILLLNANMIGQDRWHQVALRHRLIEINLGSNGWLKVGALP